MCRAGGPVSRSRDRRARAVHGLTALWTMMIALGMAAPASAGPRAVALNEWEPIGPTLTTIFVVARDPVENGTLLAGTNFGGMYRSTNGGLAWSLVDSPFNADAVFGIAIAPTTPRTILVATQSGGLYRSTDDGASWAAITTGLPAGTVRTVAFDPFNSQRALVATDAGVFRSIDGGVTWSPTMTASVDFIIQHLLYDGVQQGVVYAGALGSGMHRSVDGGASWNPFSDGIGLADIVAVSQDENIAGRVWAATTAGVFSREPADAAWVDWTLDLPEDALVKHVATIAGRPEVVAATDKGVYTVVPDPQCLISGPPDPPPADEDPPEEPVPCSWFEWYDVSARKVIADRTGHIVHVIHAINYFEATIDYGENWYPSARGMQNLFCGALTTIDVDGITGIYAGTGNDIRATAAGYIEEGEQQWGLQLDVGGAIFELAAGAQDPSRILAGTEGFGVLRSTNYGNDWTNASTGMVPTSISDIDQSRGPKGTMYAGTSAGMYISADEGRTWQQRAQNQNPVPIVDVEADPAFAGWVYYATEDGWFYRSQDDGTQFFPLWKAPAGDAIRQLDRAPFFEIYAVLRSGELYASDDGGINFFRRGSTDITHRVLCVATTDDRPWVAYVGTEFGGVYHTGSNGIEWERRATGLGDTTISSLAVAIDDDRIVVAGSKGGVYVSPDEGMTWKRHTWGLPPDGIVSSLSFDPIIPTRLYARVTIPVVEPKPALAVAQPAAVISPRRTGPRPAAPPFSWFQEGLDAKEIPTSAVEGLYTSGDRGKTWYLVTKHEQYTKGTALCASRTEPGTVVVGADLVGIARTTNAGITWEPPSSGLTLIVLSVAVDPTDAATMYAATFSSGVFKSTDGGDTWAHTGPDGVIVFHIAVDPMVHTTIYASTSLGVMRSDDAGATWRLAGQDTPYIITVATDPAVPDRVYACSFQGKVYRSDDGGATWADISAGLPVDDINDAVVSPVNGTVYVLSAEHGVFRSHDHGATWWPANNSAFEGLRAIKIAIDPTYNDLYVGLWGGGLRSPDGGDTWVALPLDFGQDYPSAISIAQLPGGQSAVFISVLNEQGEGIDPGRPVMRSADRGATWTLLGGNGIPATDASAVVVAPGPAPRVYTATVDGVYLSDDLGQTWQYASGGLAGVTIFEMDVDPTDPQHVVAATSGGLYETTNGGASWSITDFDYADIGAMSLSAAFGPAGRLYVGTSERGVFATTNGGVSWRGGVTPETAVMVPQALAVDPVDRSTIWVATGDQGVAVSRDRGETWTLANNGLGAEVMFTITIDPEEHSTIYTTSQDAGVWVSVDSGATWAPLNTGLTNAFVTAFAIDANNHKIIYAGTEGGGVFRLTRP